MSLRALQVFVLCVVGAAPTDLVNEVKTQEAEIVEALQSRTLWEYETERDTLLGYIETARQLRLSATAPILAEHLAFGHTLFELHPLPIERKYLVCPALVAIGTPSVPHLIERLSIVDPDDQLGSGFRQHNLAIWCLVEIYGPGDNGKKLAKRRIELAAEAATGPFKERLLRAAKKIVLDPNRAEPVRPLCVASAPPTDLVNEVKTQEAEIVEALQSRTLWEYETERDEVLSYIETARQLRLSATAPILAEHLAFGPTDLFELHPTTIEKKFPVCPALVAIGTPSVPHLIQRLSVVDPDDQAGTGARQHALAIWCLIEIYGPGDQGQKLAKLRIELAAEEAEGPFKERLLRAAKNYVVDRNRGK